MGAGTWRRPAPTAFSPQPFGPEWLDWVVRVEDEETRVHTPGRPRIAITLWRRELPTFVSDRTLLYTLADEYVTSVTEAGGLPLLVPHLDGDAAADAVLDAVDGLVVAGGGDVDPSSYGARNTASKDVDAQADRSELALLRRARQRRMPTLAICRGMQLVVVAEGGRLEQDITTRSADPQRPHLPISDRPDEVLAARHTVDILPGSRLAAVFGAGPREVNTIHHQGITELPDSLRATAYAADGLIEAVEPTTSLWPLLAVQWHPEKMAESDHALFEAFVAAASANVHRPAPAPVAAG